MTIRTSLCGSLEVCHVLASVPLLYGVVEQILVLNSDFVNRHSAWDPFGIKEYGLLEREKESPLYLHFLALLCTTCGQPKLGAHS